jgi:hypothetical protein
MSEDPHQYAISHRKVSSKMLHILVQGIHRDSLDRSPRWRGVCDNSQVGNKCDLLQINADEAQHPRLAPRNALHRNHRGLRRPNALLHPTAESIPFLLASCLIRAPGDGPLHQATVSDRWKSQDSKIVV